MVASKLKHGKTTIGFSFRSNMGEEMRIGAEQTGDRSVLQVEALTFYKGLKLAIKLGILKLEIERDNLSLINVLRKENSCPWEIKILVINIRMLLTSFTKTYISHINRRAYRVANKIVKHVHLYLVSMMGNHPNP